MYCEHCGKLLDKEALFCGRCGTKQEAAQDSAGSAVVLSLFAIIPGLILFFILRRTRRYQAQCPSCERLLSLTTNEARVLDDWGSPELPSPVLLIRSAETLILRALQLRLWATVAIVFVGVLVGVLFHRDSSAGEMTTSSSKETVTSIPSPPTPSAVGLTEGDRAPAEFLHKPDLQSEPVFAAEALIGEYFTNEVRSEVRFKGTRVNVRGEIKDMARDNASILYVVFEGTQGDQILKCSFPDHQRASLAALEIGQTVTLSGPVIGTTVLKLGDFGVVRRLELSPCEVLVPSRVY